MIERLLGVQRRKIADFDLITFPARFVPIAVSQE
jgi:hypothetical protein